MPRPRNTRPSELLHVCLPPEVKQRVELLLYSESEQRVPRGAWQRFLVERINEFFSSRRLDLEAFGFPPSFFIKGPPECLEALKAKLGALK